MRTGLCFYTLSGSLRLCGEQNWFDDCVSGFGKWMRMMWVFMNDLMKDILPERLGYGGLGVPPSYSDTLTRSHLWLSHYERQRILFWLRCRGNFSSFPYVEPKPWFQYCIVCIWGCAARSSVSITKAAQVSSNLTDINLRTCASFEGLRCRDNGCNYCYGKGCEACGQGGSYVLHESVQMRILGLTY